jgi:ADP-ribosylation factor-like protein 6
MSSAHTFHIRVGNVPHPQSPHPQAFGLLKREAKIIVVGLDNSGKSTLINHLKPKKSASYEVAPTVGFSVETFDRDKLRFTVIDMSGAGTYRSLWETYYADVQAIIFVIDSTDKIRMCVAKDELDALLAHADVKRNATAPLLVFANKMDLPGSLEPTDVSLVMGLPQIQQRGWQIQCVNIGGGG